ncbi:OmpA family protein [Maribacter arenosus]|uniref:OmpA family protein n=1 Tax=Maribacter arenosus TaxID=1854708 RepID=A0ABR7VKE6_9FLAO|nr:OmpA family protein [Maribacter arenosus]MBD0852554.1 OmpA family protein [Maribacter arenosus]
MKYRILFCLALLLSSCKPDPKEQGKDVTDTTTKVTEETTTPRQAPNTFGETTEAFLESVGADEELKAEYLQKLKEMENMPADSSGMVKMLEALMAEAIQREKMEGKAEEKRHRRLSGNMDDLTAAFQKLNAESGVEATIGKLKKVDSITGQNSFQVLDIDQETIDKMTETTKKASPKKELPPKGKMTDEEMEMMRAFTKANSNLHNTAELDKLQQMIESSDLEKMAAENKITYKYAQMQGNEFERIKKRWATKKQEVTNAKQSFEKMNPDLYFGDEVGMTYFGNRGKAVYLPLGKLSFADQVIDMYHPENKKTATFSLGEPDAYTTGMNSAMNVHSMGLKGRLVVKFEDNALVDVNGPDLYIFELGQIEPTNLDISKDGKTWITVGKISGGVAEVDIHDFVERDELYYYVRLTDLETSSGIPGADVDAIAAIGSAVRLNLDSQVLFDTGKSELKPEGMEALKKLVESISVLKKGNVIVEGHTDNVGSAESNKKLSLARAKSVSAELKKLLPSQNFKWKERGHGEEKPLVENDSEKNRAKNRRVEILVTPY